MSAFRKLSSIYVFSYFPFGFEGRIWDLIVSVPDHCLSFLLFIEWLSGKFGVPNVVLLHFALFSSMFCLKQLRYLSFYALIQCCILLLIGLFEDYQNTCNEHKMIKHM